MSQDPWANNSADPSNPDSDDEFDSATSDYLTVSDIDGRLVLIWPHELREEVGTTGVYKKIIADVAILDGTPGETERRLGFEATPYASERMHLSNKAIVETLTTKVGTGRPTLGRITSAPSKVNRTVRAFWLGEPTSADANVARQYLRTPGSFRPRVFD